MGVLQKLVRANALLLQGAYEGAEHVLDSAIVDVRELIGKADNAEQLQIRMGEMAAEIDRLNAEREQLMAQEPVLWQGKTDFKTDTRFKTLKPSDEEMVRGEFFPLYAQAVPAQQVTDKFNGDDRKLVECATALLELDAKGALVPHGIGGHARTIIESLVARMQPSPSVALPDSYNDAVKELQEYIDYESLATDEREMLGRVLAAMLSISPSTRITEQDAAVKAWKDAIETLSKGSENGVHPDDVAVNRFIEAMKIKLAKSRDKGRGGWENPALCKVIDLASRLIDHLPKGDPVDVANFAMMLFFREGGNAALSDAGRALLNKLNDKPVVYVAPSAKGTGDGSSEANAMSIAGVIRQDCIGFEDGSKNPHVWSSNTVDNREPIRGNTVVKGDKPESVGG